MTKICCGDSVGIDIDQVVAWKKVKLLNSSDNNEALTLWFEGANDGFSVSRSTIGCQAFAYLHRLLLDRFAIDLAGDNDISISDDTSLVDELEDLPY